MKEKYVFGELDQYLFGQGTHYDITGNWALMQ